MFGMMEALLSFLRRQVGLRTDAANAAGSLHAKVTDIVSNKLPPIQKARGILLAGSYSTGTLGTWFTALNIAGRGRLVGLLAYNNYANGVSVKVTVDGNVINSTTTPGGSVVATYYPLVNWLFGGGWDTTGNPRNAELHFKSSLKIEMLVNDNPNVADESGAVYWIYEIE